MKYRNHPVYENYKVSNTGEVLNIKTNKKLQKLYGNGYHHCELQENPGINNSWFMKPIHILVAEVWLTPPPGFKGSYVIEHIDGIKTNNEVSNLRWITKATMFRKAFKKHNLNRELHCYDAATGKYLKSYDFARDAVKDIKGLDYNSVLAVANGKYKHTKGYIFSDYKHDCIEPIYVHNTSPNSKRSRVGPNKTSSLINETIKGLIEDNKKVLIGEIADIIDITRQTVSKYMTEELKLLIKEHNDSLKS